MTSGQLSSKVSWTNKKKMRVRDKDVPYMTSEWKIAIRQKRKHAQIYARDRSLENWELNRKWRNIATSERRKAIKYWPQKSDELRSRPGNVYKTFNPFFNSKGKGTTNIAIEVQERIEKDQHIVAEVMGDFFATMANDIGGQNVMQLYEQDFHGHQSVEAIRQSYDGLHFEFKAVTPELVEKELRNLNTNKVPGWDAISPRILKLSAEALTPSLIQIFNTCIRSGQWPATWKMGQWIPVFKRDDRTVCSSYRPITVLNQLRKSLNHYFTNRSPK